MGVWKLNEDLLGTDQFVDCAASAIAKHFPKAKNLNDNDRDHLHAHYLLKRDVFLTHENAIHVFARKFLGECNIDLKVMSPSDFLQGFNVTQ